MVLKDNFDKRKKYFNNFKIFYIYLLLLFLCLIWFLKIEIDRCFEMILLDVSIEF